MDRSLDLQGHRHRLRDRFYRSGLDGFQDYEIIELLLTLGTPRKDCKPAAKAALKRFGTLRGVLEAEPKELQKIPGLGPNNIIGLRLIHAVARRYLEERIVGQEYARSSRDVARYLRHYLRDRTRELFLCIYLNGRNQILACKTLFEGTLTASAVYPREVIKSALAEHAAALIFVHNHPSGNPQPSEEDRRITKKLREAAQAVDIAVHDHLIVAGDEMYSFADHGMI
ncbi:MAG: JAB domain-containing protein [Candidatus Neomarinimicrobiota bacterium]|nr:MAG: JAB domain-containing protein [Candidatus Neomarinimicrobiota bacterium]